MPDLAKNAVAKTELIIGGQKSGKSRRAELLAKDWLLQSPDHKAVLIATAQAWDEEMQQRIARHQRDRAERVPGLTTVEEPLHLVQTINRLTRPDTLLVVDCLTLWLTNLLMPVDAKNKPTAVDYITYAAMLNVAIQNANDDDGAFYLVFSILNCYI